MYEHKIPIERFAIKSNKGLFTINLLRFLGEKDSPIENCDAVYKFCERKNEEFKAPSKLSFKLLKPVVVISDQYLSNPDPVILS